MSVYYPPYPSPEAIYYRMNGEFDYYKDYEYKYESGSKMFDRMRRLMHESQYKFNKIKREKQMSFITIHVSYAELLELSKLPNYISKNEYMSEFTWLDHEFGALLLYGKYVRIIHDLEEITETITKKTLRMIK